MIQPSQENLINLEHVFKTGGVPTFTFVEPQEYTKLFVSLRTPGRGLIIEGPSGIGKTTAVEKALEQLGLSANVTKLSARKSADVEYIRMLPEMADTGVVIIDDFHRLDGFTRSALADYLKTLADEEAHSTKLIILGINRAGERLVEAAHDLVNRIDTIRFEANPEHKVEELIRKGELALNIRINVKQEIISEASGSFYIAQMLCHEVCIKEGVLNRQEPTKDTAVSFEAIRSEVWHRFGTRFRGPCATFCRGSKMKREGRAPYLHILNWLANGKDWTVSLYDEMRRHPEMRGSVGQVVDKGFLTKLLHENPNIEEILHFDTDSSHLTVNDPQFVFYIRNIPWNSFARELGFVSAEISSRYDFALSFAGEDRAVAEALFQRLEEAETETFYDHNEQHRILAEDVEEYLRPIYQSEAKFILCLLSKNYPRKIWTKFESDTFKRRFENGEIIPIWFPDSYPGFFDETRNIGGLTFDPQKDHAEQITHIVSVLLRKLADSRQAST